MSGSEHAAVGVRVPGSLQGQEHRGLAVGLGCSNSFACVCVWSGVRLQPQGSVPATGETEI